MFRTIPVLAAIGTASTELAAFDDALGVVGATNFNLVRLSSVIPPAVDVDPNGKTAFPAGAWGDRLYCVYAEARSSERGAGVAAGIGWVKRLDDEGGLFVEHEVVVPSAEMTDVRNGLAATPVFRVETLIRNSLRDLVAGRSDYAFGDVELVTIADECGDDPVCALVLAAYDTAGWAK